MIKRWDQYGTFINPTLSEQLTKPMSYEEAKRKEEVFKETIFSLTSPGELFDKLSILQIKKDKGLDVDEEFQTLNDFLFDYFPTVSILYDSLLASNRVQWDYEDVIRSEKNMEIVGKTAVEIRLCNDNRVALKNKINKKLRMGFEEKKDYKRS